MSDYQDRINLLQEKINKLKEKEVLITKRRKASFGDLVEKLNLLHLSDSCMAGLLLSFKEKLSAKPDEAQGYETRGQEFFKQRSKEVAPHSPISLQANSYETALD